MLTEQDIGKLISRMQGIFATRDDIRELMGDIDGLRETVQMLSVSIDKLVKSVEDLKQEYSLVVHQLDKHEKWIRQIAKKAGVMLVE